MIDILGVFRTGPKIWRDKLTGNVRLVSYNRKSQVASRTKCEKSNKNRRITANRTSEVFDYLRNFGWKASERGRTMAELETPQMPTRRQVKATTMV